MSRFWSPRIEKSQFFNFFNENFSFFEHFCRSPGRPPDARNFFQQQFEQNRPIWGAHPKIGNILPPKSSIPKPSSARHFKAFKIYEFCLRAGFWDRGFGGSNVADFLMRPSDSRIFFSPPTVSRYGSCHNCHMSFRVSLGTAIWRICAICHIWHPYGTYWRYGNNT